MLQNEVLEATNVAAAQLAKDYRVRVILNAAPARPLGPDLAANVVVTAGGLGLAVAERGNAPYAEAAHLSNR